MNVTFPADLPEDTACPQVTSGTVGAGRTDIAWQLEATGWLDLFEIHDTVGAAITEIG